MEHTHSQKLILQLLIITQNKRVSYTPVLFSQSQVVKSYNHIICDTRPVDNYLVCTKCHELMKFKSIDRSYSSLLHHTERCNRKQQA